MSSSFTPNKNIQEPAAGDFVDAWATPVNANWTIIDQALGGTTDINVTGASGVVTLTATQYTPPNIEFTGTVSGIVNYQLPTGVGGVWTIRNSTTGSGSVEFSINAGNVISLGPNRTLLVSDGSNLDFSDSGTINSAQTYANGVAAAAESAAITAAETSAAATYVPLTRTVGLMTGVTIAADPGTTPSGAPGNLYLYY